MIKSPYLEELREKVRIESRAEGRAEGKAETLQTIILKIGRQRFQKAATRTQKAKLTALTDVAGLERIGDRLLKAKSWIDLLATP